LLLQYSRQLSYYYCLLNTATVTTPCICSTDDDKKNNSPAPAVPLQKTTKFFWTDEPFTEAGNQHTAAVVKILNKGCYYFNTGFYRYRHCSSLLRPPQLS
jgi:hypothetical protein